MLFLLSRLQIYLKNLQVNMSAHIVVLSDKYKPGLLPLFKL